MQQRELTGGLNPYKNHLWRLPSVQVERWDSYQGTSKKAIVLFPLFGIADDDFSLEHHIVRSACWARRSWLMFSDIQEHDVPIGFYVEETVKDRVMDLIAESGLGEESVWTFDGTPFTEPYHPFLGKKLAIFNDPQFSDYDWVLQMDSDMFLASVHRERLGVMSWLFAQEPIAGTVAAYTEHGPGPHHTLRDFHWWHRILPPSFSLDERYEEWKRRAVQIIGEIGIVDYESPDAYTPSCHGGVYFYPARHWSGTDIGEWVARVGNLMQDDEAVFSLWMWLGREFLSMHHAMGVPYCTEAAWIRDMRHEQDVYFLHTAMPAEWFWREDIDAL